jgi:hypothetical protein
LGGSFFGEVDSALDVAYEGVNQPINDVNVLNDARVDRISKEKEEGQTEVGLGVEAVEGECETSLSDKSEDEDGDKDEEQQSSALRRKSELYYASFSASVVTAPELDEKQGQKGEQQEAEDMLSQLLHVCNTHNLSSAGKSKWPEESQPGEEAVQELVNSRPESINALFSEVDSQLETSYSESYSATTPKDPSEAEYERAHELSNEGFFAGEVAVEEETEEETEEDEEEDEEEEEEGQEMQEAQEEQEEQEQEEQEEQDDSLSNEASIDRIGQEAACQWSPEKNDRAALNRPSSESPVASATSDLLTPETQRRLEDQSVYPAADIEHALSPSVEIEQDEEPLDEEPFDRRATLWVGQSGGRQGGRRRAQKAPRSGLLLTGRGTAGGEERVHKTREKERKKEQHMYSDV